MRNSAADKIILSYNDAVLRQSDLEILNNPYFLNDRLIEFYFSYLSTSHSSPDILLVPPSIAFWIMNCPDADSLKDFVEPLKLPEKKLIIFPVNNNEDVSTAEGGTHWTLLAYHRTSNTFVHHDSSVPTNKRHAMRLFKAVVGFIGDCSSSSDTKYQEYVDSPQQMNGYDCGLYVTAIARAICSWYEGSENKDAEKLWLSDVKEQITPSAVAEMRKEILDLIQSLMDKKC